MHGPKFELAKGLPNCIIDDRSGTAPAGARGLRFLIPKRMFLARARAVASRCVALVLATLFVAGCSKNVDELMASARSAHETGKHRTAVVQLKELLQQAPDNAEARYLLGICHGDIGDFVSAEKELRRALDLQVDYALVLPPLAKSLLEQGMFQKVLAEADPQRAPNDQVRVEFLTERGLAYLGLGRIAEARQAFEEALAKQPESTAAVIGLARLAAQERKPDEAGRLIERALAGAPRSREAWIVKGDLLRASGQGGADIAYEKAVEINPEYVPALLRLIAMYISANRFEEAQRLLVKVSESAPGSPTVRYTKALIEFRKANYAGALEEVLRLLKVVPDHLPSLMLAGEVEYVLGFYGQAITHLTRVVEREPGNVFARKLLIMSLARSGNTQRALEAVDSELRRAPRDATLLVLAGEVSLQAGDFGKAADYFEKGARLDPKSASARTGLASSRLSLGDTTRALADLEDAMRLEPENQQAELLTVAVHLQRNEFDKALDQLQRLEQKQPKDARTQNLKAAAYLGKKDPAAARTHLERALQLEPIYLPAALNLARLDLQDGNPQAARRRIEAVLGKDPNHVQALLELAQLGPRIGASVEEQIQWLERAYQASPTTVKPQIMLARLYALTNRPMKALEFARRAQAGNPGSVEALSTLASFQMAYGEKTAALATYGKLAQLQPDSPATLFSLANAQIVNADSAGAAATLRKALLLKPDFTEAQIAMADLEIRAGRFPEATKIARQVQKQDPQSPVGLALEADVLLAEKKYEQAAKVYERAYAIRKSGTLAMKMHAAYSHANRSAEAAERMAQWLKFSPDDQVARLYMADMAMKDGNYKSAIEHFEWVRRNDPDNAAVLNNLAWSYQRTGNALALEAAERAYTLKPEDPEIADTLGWILTERGDAARGLEILKKASAASPKSYSIRYHLAQAWLKTGDRERARDELEGLLSSNPSFQEQAEARKLLDQLRK